MSLDTIKNDLSFKLRDLVLQRTACRSPAKKAQQEAQRFKTQAAQLKKSIASQKQKTQAKHQQEKKWAQAEAAWQRLKRAQVAIVASKSTPQAAVKQQQLATQQVTQTEEQTVNLTNSKRPIYKTMSNKEQVVIPLGRARYQVQSSWDRTVVVITNSKTIAPKAWIQLTKGVVVGRLAVNPLVWGTIRVVVELNQPVTPEIRVVKQGELSYLYLTYSRS